MLQCQHCTRLTVFFPIISLFIPSPASLVWYTPSGRYSTCTGTTQGWKLNRPGNLRAAETWILPFRAWCLKPLLTLYPTLPTQSRDVRLIWQSDSQLLQFSAQQSWTKAVIFPQRVQIWNLWQHMNTSATPVHQAARAGTWDRAHFTGQNVRDSFTQAELCLAIISQRAVYWNSAFISHDDTISFVLLKQKSLKFHIDNSASRDNGSSQGPYKKLPKMFDKPKDKK